MTLNSEIEITMTIILDIVHYLEPSVTLFLKLDRFPLSNVREERSCLIGQPGIDYWPVFCFLKQQNAVV
jgi:hypothetical protein